MAEDIFADDKTEIAELEKPQREDRGTPARAPESAPEPKPEPVAAPEPQAKQPEPDDADDTVEVENKGRFVRYGALREAREKAAELKKERDELQARYASDLSKARDDLAKILQSQQKPVVQEQAPQLPDIDTDPVGHLRAKIAQNEAQLEEEKKWRKSQEETQQNAGRMEAVKKEVERLEREYVAKVPDYYEAQKFLVDSWVKQAQAIGMDPSQAVAARTLETIQIAAQRNMNPAEVAHLLAKSVGYAGQVQSQAPANNLETVARGQAVARSPSAIPGSPPSGTPAIDALANMDDDDFAKAIEGGGWDKIKKQMLGNAARF